MHAHRPTRAMRRLPACRYVDSDDEEEAAARLGPTTPKAQPPPTAASTAEDDTATDAPDAGVNIMGVGWGGGAYGVLGGGPRRPPAPAAAPPDQQPSWVQAADQQAARLGRSGSALSAATFVASGGGMGVLLWQTSDGCLAAATLPAPADKVRVGGNPFFVCMLVGRGHSGWVGIHWSEACMFVGQALRRCLRLLTSWVGGNPWACWQHLLKGRCSRAGAASWC